MREFDPTRFEEAWQQSKERAERVLERSKGVQVPSEVSHTYTDKYRLAERLAASALHGVAQSLHIWGIGEEQRAQCQQWLDQRASITLEFRAEEKFNYRGTRKRKEPGTETVTSLTSPRGIIASISQRWSVRTTDYVWKYSLHYQAVLVCSGGLGSEGDNQELVVFDDTASGELLMGHENAFPDKSRVRTPERVDITWFLQRLDSQGRVTSFPIDRENSQCYTPRRNPDIERCIEFARAWDHWAGQVVDFFLVHVYRYGQQERVDMNSIHARDIFVPVLTLFHSPEADSKDVLPSETDHLKLMNEQQRTLTDKMTTIQKTFPETKDELIRYLEVKRIVLLQHTSDLCQAFYDGVQFTEEMLRRQLVEAIGKTLQPKDFAQYMNFHYRKMFTESFRPVDFCYAVSRDEHHPEGVVSVEAYTGEEWDPVSVFTRRVEETQPMHVALNAATSVRLESALFVHTWINHRFSASPYDSHLTHLQLLARSGQFSSYILVVGNMIAPDQLMPQAAIIVQSRDIEVCIPLLVEEIPSPQAFRKAVESLSPEQLAFVSAYRRMQLESTLFGLAVVQIKPQLEKVLGLAPDALTKHVELVEDLLDLLIRYQIPTDLLAYDGLSSVPRDAQVHRVRILVKEMKEMIESMKQEELEEVKKEAKKEAPLSYTRHRNKQAEPVATLSFDAASYKSKGSKNSKLKKKKVSKDRKVSPLRRSSKKQENRTKSPSLSLADESDVAGAPESADAPESGSQDPQQPHEFIDQEDGAWKGFDVTTIPTQLDEAFDLLDPEGALRAATLQAQTHDWKRTYRASLLSEPTTEMLPSERVRDYKNQAFDLMDVLTRSGLISFDHCEVHVMLAATHLFDRTLMDTIICRNVNPIDRMSRSAYIVNSILHAKPSPSDMLHPTYEDSLRLSSPFLFPALPAEEAHEEEHKEEKEAPHARDSRVSNAEVVSKIEAKLARLAQSGGE